jgi:hypothetical protein
MIVITYTVTIDNFDGSPWMPDGDDFWSIVARTRDRTKWRRVDLAANDACIIPRRQTQRANKMTTANLPTNYTDPIEELAREARDNIENALKFVKGEWLLNDEEVPDGIELVACVDHIVRGWIRWDDQKAAERILVRRGDRQRLPDRDELSYAEESDWPCDTRGKKRDPWQKQFYLPMINMSDGKLVTFVTPSVGGKIAIGKLCDAFLNNDRRRPIVKLDAGSFKSKEYGKVDSPAFLIIGYEDEPIEQPPTQESVPAAALPATNKTKTKKGKSDFDDEIPY